MYVEYQKMKTVTVQHVCIASGLAAPFGLMLCSLRFYRSSTLSGSLGRRFMASIPPHTSRGGRQLGSRGSNQTLLELLDGPPSIQTTRIGWKVDVAWLFDPVNLILAEMEDMKLSMKEDTVPNLIPTCKSKRSHDHIIPTLILTVITRVRL